MKTILIAVVALLSASVAGAQINNAKTETAKVSGNCGMCETTIEKAGNKKKLYRTDWNVDTKMASITYDSKKTDLDAVLKSIALSGYDNVKYLAPDEAYNKLHGCCKYERSTSEKKAACCSDEASCNHDDADHKEAKADCCKDGKCTKEGHNGKDCCKKSE